MRGTRKTRGRVAAAIVLVSLAAGPAALGQSIPVQTTVASGSRTLDLTTPTGAALSSMSVGGSGTAPFMARVTDVAYSRSGYQVTAMMSDLYGYADGVFDCGKKLDSSAMALGFLTDPVSVADIRAQLQPVFDLTGTIDGALGLLLGLLAPLALDVPGVDGELADAALEGVFAGVEDALPVKVAAGAAGPFADPAVHADCDPDPGVPATTRAIMAGNPSDLGALLAWVQAAVEDLADLDSGGTITGTELVDSGLVDEAVLAAAVRDALILAGVSGPLLDSLIDIGTVTYAQLFALLTATVDTVTSIIGQSGLYLALPQLVSTIPGGTSAGTYRGTMTVTLVDVP